MKRVVLWVCALMMTLMASVCVAGTYSPYFATEPPREVREHVANRWPDYEFEDYCEVRGTPKGDYGFALVHRKNERILVGYHKVDGEMKYWLKNAGAVPQARCQISMAKVQGVFWNTCLPANALTVKNTMKCMSRKSLHIISKPQKNRS